MDGSKQEARLLLLTCDPRQLSLRAEIERRHALRALIRRDVVGIIEAIGAPEPSGYAQRAVATSEWPAVTPGD